MPRIVETTVYELHELSESAQEKVRAWYRDTCMDFDWHDFVYEDFRTICELLGVTLDTRPVRLCGGGARQDPCIYFSGFWSQGDGASFAGSYQYRRGACRDIRAHAPEDTDLHHIADRLQALQRRNFYQLLGGIRQSGRYCHEFTMWCAVERDSPVGQDATIDAKDTFTGLMRMLARWLYRALEREYESQTSDAAIDDTIGVNGWTFTAEGRFFC